MPTEIERIRLDKWLWAARFYKTRTLAADAVSGGKVHLNGNRVKPAHGVALGDQLQIHKGAYEYIIWVKELSVKRGPPRIAGLLYEETPESIAARVYLADLHRLFVIATPRTDKRPNKKQRRQLSRLIGRDT